MRRALVAGLVSIGLAEPSAAQTPHDPADVLEWVAHTTPQAQLDADLRAGIRRFWIVCGISCAMPGSIDDATYRLCYQAAATAEELAGTTDYVTSPRLEELQPVASRFAREYNTLLAERLDRDGRRECPIRGSPDEWLAPARSAVARFGTDAQLWCVPRGSPGTLEVSLPPASEWEPADARGLCAALAQGGLSQRRVVVVWIPSAPKRIVTCERGGLVGESAPRSPAVAPDPPPPASQRPRRSHRRARAARCP